MARAADDDATELAKETQNPVADLISVPFQNNFDFGAGSKDETVWLLTGIGESIRVRSLKDPPARCNPVLKLA